jgi:RNA polymerase primary sigma factor
LPVEKVVRLMESQRAALSLDEPVDDEGELTLLDRIVDASAEDPTQSTDRIELQHEVEKALAGLTPKEQKVLRMRFGFGGRELSTLEEIGGRMGVSRERVRQIEARALKTLHRHGQQLDAYLHAG